MYRESGISKMRYLWITSIVMVVCGLALVAGKLVGILDPVALVLGLLTLWSGIVKIIVLRIWQRSLNAAVVEAPPPPPARLRSLFGRQP
jgi:hypothetical protein